MFEQNVMLQKEKRLLWSFQIKEDDIYRVTTSLHSQPHSRSLNWCITPWRCNGRTHCRFTVLSGIISPIDAIPVHLHHSEAIFRSLPSIPLSLMGLLCRTSFCVLSSSLRLSNLTKIVTHMFLKVKTHDFV